MVAARFLGFECALPNPTKYFVLASAQWPLITRELKNFATQATCFYYRMESCLATMANVRFPHCLVQEYIIILVLPTNFMILWFFTQNYPYIWSAGYLVNFSNILYFSNANRKNSNASGRSDSMSERHSIRWGGGVEQLSPRKNCCWIQSLMDFLEGCPQNVSHCAAKMRKQNFQEGKGFTGNIACGVSYKNTLNIV